jgi:hypothetical protein
MPKEATVHNLAIAQTRALGVTLFSCSIIRVLFDFC